MNRALIYFTEVVLECMREPILEEEFIHVATEGWPKVPVLK